MERLQKVFDLLTLNTSTPIPPTPPTPPTAEIPPIPPTPPTPIPPIPPTVEIPPTPIPPTAEIPPTPPTAVELIDFSGIGLSGELFVQIAPPAELDIDKLSKLIGAKIDLDMPYFVKYGQNFGLDPNSVEWRVTEACNGTWKGAGNTPYDILTPKGIKIDVCCVCLNGSQTNEKSVIQKFRGQDLDELFRDRLDDEVVNLFTTALHEKMNKDGEDLVYMFLISTKTSVYVACFKVNIESIKNIRSLGFTKEGVSVNVSGVIDPDLGICKAYKSKKRLEIRLRSSILEQTHTIKIYPPIN